MNAAALWSRFQKHLCQVPRCGMALDISRMNFDDGLLERMRQPMACALEAMKRLEGGELANSDEERMVGHYWLRNWALAPDADIRRDIEHGIGAVKEFAAAVHGGQIHPQKSDGFDVLLCIGIGGSALGPQLVSDALANERRQHRHAAQMPFAAGGGLIADRADDRGGVVFGDEHRHVLEPPPCGLVIEDGVVEARWRIAGAKRLESGGETGDDRRNVHGGRRPDPDPNSRHDSLSAIAAGVSSGGRQMARSRRRRLATSTSPTGTTSSTST